MGRDRGIPRIERAIRLGRDTDTTAIIAGGLAGLRWGLDEGSRGIPREWLSALGGRDIVELILAQLMRENETSR